MAETSSNLKLVLPDQYDKVEIRVLSENFSKVDNAIGQRIETSKIVDNLTTVEKGFVLDASQGMVLSEAIGVINTNQSALDKAKVDVMNVAVEYPTDEIPEEDRQKKVLSTYLGMDLNNRVTDLESARSGMFKNWTVTFTAAGWNTGSAPYTQEVAVEGMKAEYNPDYDVDWSNVTDSNRLQTSVEFGLITLIETSEGKIKGYCYSKAPTINIPIRLKEVV